MKSDVLCKIPVKRVDYSPGVIIVGTAITPSRNRSLRLTSEPSNARILGFPLSRSASTLPSIFFARHTHLGSRRQRLLLSPDYSFVVFSLRVYNSQLQRLHPQELLVSQSLLRGFVLPRAGLNSQPVCLILAGPMMADFSIRSWRD